MTRIPLILGGIIILVVVGILATRGGERSPIRTPPATSPPPTLGKAPSFNLADYSGKIISPSDFAGKPLVINVWAAWCPFCGKELSDFATIQKEFGDRVGIIAIDRAETLATAKKFTDDLGVSGDLVFLLDPADSFYKAIGGFAMPETIFVDALGNIRIHKRGPMEVSEIRQKITRLLEISN